MERPDPEFDKYIKDDLPIKSGQLIYNGIFGWKEEHEW